MHFNTLPDSKEIEFQYREIITESARDLMRLNVNTTKVRIDCEKLSASNQEFLGNLDFKVDQKEADIFDLLEDDQGSDDESIANLFQITGFHPIEANIGYFFQRV